MAAEEKQRLRRRESKTHTIHTREECGRSDRNPVRRRTVVPVRRNHTTYHWYTVNARVLLFSRFRPRACTFAYTLTHAHRHAHRHNGATNYSGQNGTSSIINPRVRFHHPPALNRPTTTYFETNEFASARTVLLVHTVRAGQS